jgi:hypothetical protein
MEGMIWSSKGKDDFVQLENVKAFILRYVFVCLDVTTLQPSQTMVAPFAFW